MVSCEGLGRGGVQSIMMSIVRNMSNEYVFDILLFTNDKRYYDDEFVTFGGNIIRIPHYSGNNYFRRKIDYYVRGFIIKKKFARIIKTNKYDIIHCNNGFEAGILVKIAKRHNIPIRIVQAHVIEKKSNTLTNLYNYYRRYKINRFSTAKIGCSNEACESLFGTKSSFSVINNLFDESKYYYSSTNCQKLIITQIGSFTDNKNQLFSLEILKYLIKYDSSVILNLIGFEVDNYMEKMINYINENHLKKNVIFYDENANNGEILSASKWADKIYNNYFDGKFIKKKYNVDRFTTKNVINIYRDMYGGKKI